MEKISWTVCLVAGSVAGAMLSCAVHAAAPQAQPTVPAQSSAQGKTSGGFMAQRARLIEVLQLDEPQQKKLDAITADMLPSYLSLQTMDKAQRDPARRKLNLQAQQRINAILTPDQRARYELMQAEHTVAKEKAAGAGQAAGQKAPAAGKAASRAPGS